MRHGYVALWLCKTESNFQAALIHRKCLCTLQGVLIVGERGTGKTSLALAIAAEARVPVVNVEAQELEAGLWVGQSAANVRELFQTARELVSCFVPCCLLIHYFHAVLCFDVCVVITRHLLSYLWRILISLLVYVGSSYIQNSKIMNLSLISFLLNLMGKSH